MQLVFLDFETTGLDPVRDQPLEIAAALVDHQLNPVSGYTSVIVPPHAIDGSKLDPFVIEMHTKNGLWSELREGKGLALSVVQDSFDAWLGAAAPGSLTLCGDSVHFDRAFLRNWFLPQTFAKFSHRLLDVSAFRVAREYMQMPAVHIEGAHRAGADVLASIAKARYHLSRISP